MTRRSAREDAGQATRLGVQAGVWLVPDEVPVVVAALVERENMLMIRAREAMWRAAQDQSFDAPDAYIEASLRRARADVERLLARLGALVGNVEAE